jgi:predicted nucleic acid-binding protein
MLLDSNIIIYAHKPDYQPLRDVLKNKELSASIISYLETLGYHKITDTKALVHK